MSRSTSEKKSFDFQTGITRLKRSTTELWENQMVSNVRSLFCKFVASITIRNPEFFFYELDLDIIIFIYIPIHTKLLLIRSLNNFLQMF